MRKILMIIPWVLIAVTAVAQTWETLSTENACKNRHENALAAVKNKLVLMGGRGVKPTESFDLKTNKRNKHVETPLEMHHFQAVTFNNEVWVLGAFTGGYPHETPDSKHLHL